jgi:hypothetical protein
MVGTDSALLRQISRACSVLVNLLASRALACIYSVIMCNLRAEISLNVAAREWRIIVSVLIRRLNTRRTFRNPCRVCLIEAGGLRTLMLSGRA